MKVGNELVYWIAESWLGTHELPGGRDNPFVMAMLKLDADWPDHDEVPWCSAFVNYIARQLRLPRSKSLAARSWAIIGMPVKLAEAQRGDVVVLWRGSPDSRAGHVGFFAGSVGDDIQILGGNQGDSVSVATFPRARVLTVRRLT